MTLPLDVCRCTARRLDGRVCPVRLECARYVQRTDPDVPRFLIAAWLCSDKTFSSRIPREDVA